MEPKRVYLDNNATTQVAPDVLDAMRPYFDRLYGNGSSLHQDGKMVAQAIAQARTQIAACLHTDRDNVAFTSGGTESNNWAIRGLLATQPEKRHIATTAVEHLAVLACCQVLEKQGYSVTYLGVDEQGHLNIDELADAIREDTAVVSIMQANNETGVIFPIEQIAQVVHSKGSLLHVDAVQAFGKIPIDVSAVPVDLMSLSAHKIHGPKGIGALYIRTDTPIAPMFYGGSQERGYRPGTENVPGIVGFGAAVALASEFIRENDVHMQTLRDHLEAETLNRFPIASINGDPQNRLPNTSSISFEGHDAQSLLSELDQFGIDASGGSACCARTEKISHVLDAMGIPPERARSAVRFGVSRFSTQEDIDHVLNALGQILSRNTQLQEAAHPPKPQVNPPVANTIAIAQDLGGINENGEKEGEAIESERPETIQLEDSAIASSIIDERDPVHPPAVLQAATDSASIKVSSHEETPDLIYAIGRIGHDFGTESRRESFAQSMAKETPDPHNPAHVFAHHAKNPSHAAAHIWTLTHNDIPIYAMRPEGHLAGENHVQFTNFLDGFHKLTGRVFYADYFVVSGIITGTQRLLNGHIVPLVQSDPRGSMNLSTPVLMQTVVNTSSTRMKRKLSRDEIAKLSDAIDDFFLRIVHDFQNPGIAPRDRALNYLVTHVHHLTEVFVNAIETGQRLADIRVQQSPISRPGSDCQDVQLFFFNPSNRHEQARKVYRLTVDVSDVVPVNVGQLRHWHIYE